MKENLVLIEKILGELKKNISQCHDEQAWRKEIDQRLINIEKVLEDIKVVVGG